MLIYAPDLLLFCQSKNRVLLRARLNTSVGIPETMKFLVENGIGEIFLIVSINRVHRTANRRVHTISMKIFTLILFSPIYYIHTAFVPYVFVSFKLIGNNSVYTLVCLKWGLIFLLENGELRVFVKQTFPKKSGLLRFRQAYDYTGESSF